MKNRKIIMLFMLFAVSLSACNRDEIFEREMYKALISLNGNVTGGFNIFEQEHDLSKADANGWNSGGFIAANVGGSLPTRQDIHLTVREDDDLLHLFNLTNFETEDFRNARFVPQDRYEMSDMQITIRAGERSGTTPIKLRIEGLSPDSTYFIPFRAERFNAYEMHPNKGTLLYRIHFKNFWATTRSATNYDHRGYKLSHSDLNRYLDEVAKWEEAGSEGAPPVKVTRTPTYLVKRVHPVSRNEIRLFGATKAFDASEDQMQMIPRWSIRVEIGDDGSLTIEPWDHSHLGLKVTQVKDDFDLFDVHGNTYELVDDGFGRLFRTFRLCYDYADPEEMSVDGEPVKYRMWEELRLEYKPIADR